jgi:hypothetical protein
MGRASSDRKVKKVGCSCERRIRGVNGWSRPCGVSVGVAGWRGQTHWWLWRRTPLTRHAALPLACIKKDLKIRSWLQDSNAVKLICWQSGINWEYVCSILDQWLQNSRTVVSEEKKLTSLDEKEWKKQERDQHTNYKRDHGSCRTNHEVETENC